MTIDTPENTEESKAVALKYDRATDPAPHITATGRGKIAEQIIAIAKEHGITIHKDKDLVEVLSVLEIDSIIPLEAYTAVAEILAYVYKKNASL